MVKFAHIADVHLGGWKYPELQSLNLESFSIAINKCIEEKVDFVLIAGDLFDTAFPGIEILKDSFSVFKKLSDSRIPCFIIAGSHDYSVSGKTFLDVLERAGFCKNVEDYTEDEEKIILRPTFHQRVALYGFPGRKSGLEVPKIRKIRIEDSPGLFKILMLHTTLDKVVGKMPIESVEAEKLPVVDYYALGHVHIVFRQNKFVYPGPVFPNNFQELEDLNHGGFYIVDTEASIPMKRIDLKLKEVVKLKIELNSALTATQKIIQELEKYDLKKKIVLLRLKGMIDSGSHSDIKFSQIDEFAIKKGAHVVLRNTNDLKIKELEVDIDVSNALDIEQETIKLYLEENSSDFDEFVPQLIEVLSIEKQEGETNDSFTNRIIDGSKKVLRF